MAFGIAPVIGEPRIGQPVTATPRKVLKGTSNEAFLPGGRQIDAVKSRDASNTPIDVLQCGKIMGRITATGLYANSFIGATTAAYTAGGTSLTVAAATLTELVRRVGASGTFTLVGPPAASGTISVVTVTYSAASGTTITITALSANYVSGSLIGPTDGSQIPLTFVADYQTEYGIKVTDNDGTNTSVTNVPFPLVPTEGTINAASLIDWPTDTSIQNWIINEMNQPGGGKFIFDTIL